MLRVFFWGVERGREASRAGKGVPGVIFGLS